ncbi:HpcH/HpaI aldolase/citrate lyase family protein [Enorma shizhengliae]|uniref:ATP/GTP-binding protein n=1 Tax=Enorma shizhengliae TaxID=2606615 RepID=A0A7K0G9N1_9ACTN|nr:HpcH/HpaI aldolase/citrate lyase family protein [Enorma shizhengliae]MRX79696.1 ATP/GTP-binding protein [Enorma shizhengliae]
MKHHRYNPDFKFVEEPVSFDRNTDPELLRYCLGATMYMPGYQDFTGKILSEAMPGLTSMVLCFEDACPESRLPEAEANTLTLLDVVGDALENGSVSPDAIPLIFCRVRSLRQFMDFAERLTPKQARVLCGFNFPKFNTRNGEGYFNYLKELNERFDFTLYGMPIIEDPRVAHKETRLAELMGIRDILDANKSLVLQVRVGATDFSSCFGLRRGVDYSIYDIMTVREILSDILNMFARDNDYVVSGPVWEYFRASKEMMFEDLPEIDLQDRLLRRHRIVNEEVDGLLREVILDKANGFVGRTVIHPTHVKYVNALQAVTLEEYEDASQILAAEGGVLKSATSNKMNEIGPHTRWAEKVIARSKAYGVIESERSYVELFGR